MQSLVWRGIMDGDSNLLLRIVQILMCKIQDLRIEKRFVVRVEATHVARLNAYVIHLHACLYVQPTFPRYRKELPEQLLVIP